MGNICKCRNKCKEYIQNNKLKTATNELTLFSFEGIKCNAKIVDVYDGDTFKAVIFYDNKMIKINCRSLGYDSPEMKPRLNIKNREVEIKKAHEAKDYLDNLIGNDRMVWVEFKEFDKYGRALANIYKSNPKYSLTNLESFNEQMIKKGHGYRYYGGTKEKKDTIENN